MAYKPELIYHPTRSKNKNIEKQMRLNKYTIIHLRNTEQAFAQPMKHIDCRLVPHTVGIQTVVLLPLTTDTQVKGRDLYPRLAVDSISQSTEASADL